GSALLLAGSLLVGQGCLASPAAKTGDGRITMLKGQVFVNGARAAKGSPVPVNAEVRTCARSVASFSAGCVIHVMKPNSSVVLKSDDGSFTSQLRVLTGSLLTAWGKRPAGQQAQLVTKTATMGIRGTVTFTHANGSFTLLSGSVEYTNSSGVKTTLSSTGEPVSMDSAGKPTSTPSELTPEFLREAAKAAKDAGMPALASELNKVATQVSNSINGAPSMT